MKVKFKNKDVAIKKLVQGAVVLLVDDTASYPPDVYHIHKFDCFCEVDNSVDLVVVDSHGKWNMNSSDMTWPI
jgi:hypothetical protein